MHKLKVFFTLFIIVTFIFSGCSPGSDNNSNSKSSNEEQGEIINNDTVKSSKGKVLKDDPLLTPEEIKDILTEAHAVSLKIFVEAFNNEVDGEEKPTFSEVKGDLRQYWGREITNNLEDFYNTGLWDLGYEMWLVFPLSYRDDVDEWYQGISYQTKDMVVVKFAIPIDIGLEEFEVQEVTITKEDNNWIISEVKTL